MDVVDIILFTELYRPPEGHPPKRPASESLQKVEVKDLAMGGAIVLRRRKKQ